MRDICPSEFASGVSLLMARYLGDSGNPRGRPGIWIEIGDRSLDSGLNARNDLLIWKDGRSSCERMDPPAKLLLQGGEQEGSLEPSPSDGVRSETS